ncbi:MAG: TonB-dependent receptor [Chitinophagales bacterium]|nr:TonB-dependent receptor [Chitinophagales bacterium]
MNKRYLFILYICLFTSLSYSQSINISGTVLDASSGEPLVGVIVQDQKGLSFDITNTTGYFNLSYQYTDSLTISFQHIGYQDYNHTVAAPEDQVLNIKLTAGINIQTVEVNASRSLNKPTFGISTLSTEEIQSLPTLLGEADVLKSLQILPGISGGREGTSLLHVRGGSPDQNLILIDGIPIYYPTHLGGFLSVFEPRSIQQIDVYKGGFPAKFGGRVSSVVDIQLRNGDYNKTQKELGLGILSSRLFVEGPLKKGVSSFHLSVRRSFLDILYSGVQLLINNGDERVNYNIIDGNLKLRHEINPRNRIFISYYGGGDNIRLRYKVENDNYNIKEWANISWGNQLAGFRWSHLGKRWAWNNSISFTRFKYGTSSTFETFEKATGDETTETNSFASNILDYIYHSYFDFRFNNKIKFTTGLKLTRHRFRPSITSFKTNSSTNPADTSNINSFISHELSFYGDFNIPLYTNWVLEVGLHSNYYKATTTYFDWSFQPRVSIQYTPSDRLSYSASFSQMRQPLHLLSNSSGGLPVDLWVPATSNAPVEQSSLASIGVTYTPGDWQIQTELYYKTLNKLITFEEGASFFRGTNDWESKIEASGEGISFGAECLIKKQWPKHDIIIAYTLSKHERSFPRLNKGEPFPYKYDRRHDIALNWRFRPKTNKQLSILWVYHTGDALSLAQAGFDIFTYGIDKSAYTGLTLFEGLHEGHYYGSRNSFRMPSYHRLDISWQTEKTLEKGTRKWVFGLYNSYNRINPYYIYFDENEKGERQLYQFGLFPLLPAISWIRSW